MSIASSEGFDPFYSADFAPVKTQALLAPQPLAQLNTRSNWQGLRQLALHLTILLASGYSWAHTWPKSMEATGWLALPSLVIYGFSLAAMFAAVHEGVHRSAFASHRLNDMVAWFAGLLSFYNSTFYRRYHKWHHRYTRIPGKDPELSDPEPTHWGEYLWQLSGIPWWLGKLKGHAQIALGQFTNMPYINLAAQAETSRSVRLQLGVYALGIILSLAAREPWFLLYWLLPLAVGQPILRFILLAEHSLCSLNDNALTNTRTTLTLWPIRLLMWNMPFHAEHHLYPSIPFHALPKAHEALAQHFTHVDAGYIRVNRQIVSKFHP
jgi:fatty acid desaturase